MKSAPSTLPKEAPNGLTCGIDWARDDHAVAVADARGREVYRCTVEHSAAGLRTLLGMLRKRGVGEAAIERPDGPVVDALLEAGITVVVISSNHGSVCAVERLLAPLGCSGPRSGPSGGPGRESGGSAGDDRRETLGCEARCLSGRPRPSACMCRHLPEPFRPTLSGPLEVGEWSGTAEAAPRRIFASGRENRVPRPCAACTRAVW